MGIRDYMAEKAAEKAVELTAVASVEALRRPAAALGTAIEGVGNAIGNAMESRAAKLDAEYIAKRPKNRRLVISLMEDDGRITVEVTEIDGQLLYTGKGRLSKMTASLRVCDKDGRTFAKIKKSMVTVRNPIKHEENPADFNIDFDGGGRITVKTVSKGYHDYDIEPYGWRADYGLGGHAVITGEETLFYYDDRPWHTTNTYMVDFKPNLKIEKQAVPITLAIMLHSKWSDLMQD